MLFLSAIFCAAKEDPEITAAKSMCKSGDYDGVIKRMDALIKESDRPPIDAYYYRAKAHYGKMELWEALQDYNVTARRSKKMEHQQIANNRLYDICARCCQFECNAEDFLFNEDQELMMKNRREAKKERLSDGSTLDLRLKMMGINCTWDAPLVESLFRESADAQNMAGLVQTIRSMKELYPHLKMEMYRIDLVARLAEMMQKEQWLLAQQQFFAVLPTDDDAPYWALEKLARSFHKAYQIAHKFTPQQPGNATALREAVEEIDAQDLDAVILPFAEIFTRVASAAFQRETAVSLDGLKGQIQNMTASLRCFFDLAQPCPMENMNGRYAQAIHMLLSLKAKIVDIRNATERGENQRFEIETAGKAIPQITALLHRAHQARADNTSYFQRMEETIDFFDACADHLFLLASENAVTDHYKVLGVSRNATLEEIKTAYYAIAKRLHPDAQSQAITPQQKLSMQRDFELAQNAYAVLSSPEQKSKYDAIADPLDNYKYKRAKHDGRKRIDRSFIITGRKD